MRLFSRTNRCYVSPSRPSRLAYIAVQRPRRGLKKKEVWLNTHGLYESNELSHLQPYPRYKDQICKPIAWLRYCIAHLLYATNFLILLHRRYLSRLGLFLGVMKAESALYSVWVRRETLAQTWWLCRRVGNQATVSCFLWLQILIFHRHKESLGHLIINPNIVITLRKCRRVYTKHTRCNSCFPAFFSGRAEVLFDFLQETSRGR